MFQIARAHRTIRDLQNGNTNLISSMMHKRGDKNTCAKRRHSGLYVSLFPRQKNISQPILTLTFSFGNRKLVKEKNDGLVALQSIQVHTAVRKMKVLMLGVHWVR